MKKVLVYRTSLLGLSETFIKEQLLAFTDWHGVLVGLKRSGDGLALDGLDIRLLGDLISGRWQKLRWNLTRHFDLPPRPIVERLAAEQARLIHIHFGTEAVRFWPMAKALNIPVVVTLHGFDINISREYWESGKGGHWMKQYPRRLLRLAADPRTHFIAVSDAIRQRAIELGIAAEKIVVRHIGIDVDRFRPGGLPVERRRPRALFVGRLVENKGVGYLIRAFAQARAAVPGAELLIVGDGPQRNELVSLARELDCPVQFLGSMSHEQVRAQMDEARVFCLPSVTIANGNSEGFGMVILEAQASGVPVITSSRGGSAKGIVDGETGFAHGEGDVARLASGLTRLLSDDELAGRFSAAARRHMEQNFDIRRCTRHLEEYYDEITAPR